MRFVGRSLPAARVAAGTVVVIRSWVRRVRLRRGVGPSRSGQLVGWLARLWKAVCVVLRMLWGRQRLPISSVEWRGLPGASVDSMRRNEGLCLRRHRSEDAFLRETRAVGAATVLGGLEPRAPNLDHMSDEAG